MKSFFHIALASILLFPFLSSSAQEKILIVTGGHSFEKQQFYEMFDSFENISYDTITQPMGNELLSTEKANKYSCVVFYDMFQDITETQKAAYYKLLKQGMGMVFTHHALVSYQDWPEFEEIVGGKYLLKANNNNPASTYRHDVDFTVKIADKNHPITQGMQDFIIHDEVYGSFTVGEYVKPLLTTQHPESTPIIGWYHQYERARIVYIQPGHDHYAYENKHYRLILERAIGWVSETQ